VRRSEITGLLIHEPSPGASWNDLDHVEDEVKTIKGCFEAAGAVIVNDTSTRPTVAGVLAALSDTPVNILHLACHGAQKTDPLQSAFILHDGDLAIEDLMKLDLKEAYFSFLSACQTAKGLADQPDQAVHLAASMLFCGFKSVIGTMWCVELHMY
jgi:CHAT domain-containing protein